MSIKAFGVPSGMMVTVPMREPSSSCDVKLLQKRAHADAVDVLQRINFNCRHRYRTELFDLLDDLHDALHIALAAAEHDHVKAFDELDLHRA